MRYLFAFMRSGIMVNIFVPIPLIVFWREFCE